jgi:serine/threonine-protein kinase HipA
MSSKARPEEAFVWTWLPGSTEPVAAGRLVRSGTRFQFHYGRSYLALPDAIPLYEPELPLRAGLLPLPAGLTMPSAIRDASPDAWGRRVIINRLTGLSGAAAAAAELDELTFMLESGSDRVGALDFQRSPSHYEPRLTHAPLTELLEAADLVEQGVPLTPELGQALQHGSALGGARPKAQVEEADRTYVAKFSTSGDLFAVVKAEYLAMRLAAIAGLNVASVKLDRALGKDVLLVERFDRERADDGWHRRDMVSALTLLELDEMMAAYAGYDLLADVVRHRFAQPRDMLRELFARLTFNILCGNTDDHARNHSAFWDGRTLVLTPAYDICPQSRTGGEASQAMRIIADRNLSRLSLCLEAAPKFQLSEDEAIAIIAAQIQSIAANWGAVCAEAHLSAVDRNLLWGRQFLNPYAFEDAPAGLQRPDAPAADG